MNTRDIPERYSRQVRFPGIGPDGQRKLLDSKVTLVGCGALGTVLANALVRAGVGYLRLIDRDFIETSNLQRQVLFDEHDVAESLPKAEAAARKLGAINSSVHVEPVVTDIDHTNILELVKDADLILDGTDNFEIRYLINDVAVKLDKPWIYGGCIGSHGQTMTIIPGQTPCLRCVFEAAPAPGEAGTCETAGVLAPIVNIVASFQAAEAFKILAGRREQVNRDLIYVDVWENTLRRIKVAPLLGKVDCPCCRRRRFEWLESESSGDIGQKKMIAGLLGILLGGLGIHKFYLGMTTPGLIMLLVSLLTCGIGWMIMHPIGLIEGILYLTKSDDDFEKQYLIDK